MPHGRPCRAAGPSHDPDVCTVVLSLSGSLAPSAAPAQAWGPGVHVAALPDAAEPKSGTDKSAHGVGEDWGEWRWEAVGDDRGGGVGREDGRGTGSVPRATVPGAARWAGQGGTSVGVAVVRAEQDVVAVALKPHRRRHHFSNAVANE